MSTTQDSKRRVVITGVGVVSPVGIGAEDFWRGLESGKSGIARIDRLSDTALPNNVGGEIKNFDEAAVKEYIPKKQRKNIRIMCREIQLGAVSATLALEHAALDLDNVDHARLGVEFGANQMLSPPYVLKDGCYACVDEPDGKFDFERWGNEGFGRMEPLWLLKYLPNMPACHIGIFADAQGPNNSLTLAEASGNLVLGEAMRIISRGNADIMIAGSTGARIHAVKALHAALWDTLATTPDAAEQRSRPFELNRSGQVVAEGSCSFLLEDETHAVKRGATILGTILGAGASCVADRSGRANPRAALANAMRAALRDAGLSPSEIGHINAFGLSTPQEDAQEALAIADVFGDAASKVPVTAVKSALGNSGAGSGTLEVAASVLGLAHGVVPATLNYDVPDPECPLNVVHGSPLEVSNKTFLKISVTRMGQASALVVSVP